MADRTNHKTYEDRGVCYSVLKPSAGNFGVKARIPSRSILLSSDDVAVKWLNTLDFKNSLVHSYLIFFLQTKILRCSVFFLLLILGYHILACFSVSSGWDKALCDFCLSPLNLLIIDFAFLKNFYFSHFVTSFSFVKDPLSLRVLWNLCCTYVG